MILRGAGAVACAALGLLATSAPAYADDGPDLWNVEATSTHGSAFLSLTEAAKRASDSASTPATAAFAPPPTPTEWYEYYMTPACPGNFPYAREETCSSAINACKRDDKATVGVASYVFRRLRKPGDKLDASDNPSSDGRRSDWTRVDTTCYPDQVPGRTGQQGPSLEQLVRQEFTRIKFAPPGIGIQPPDHVTYIGKPIFTFIDFENGGSGPGDVHTASLLGHNVTITPELVDITYDWGDGQKTGPTTDRGKKYPDGKITHPYRHKGTYTVTVTATYTANFSVDGQPVRPVGMTTTTTSATTVTVNEAKNVLVP